MNEVAADGHAGFDAFFRSTYPHLVALGIASFTERAVAQDLAQETLVRAHQHWGDLLEYDSPMAWCRRVMINLLIDQHRRRTTEQAVLSRAADAQRVAAGTDADDPAVRASIAAWHDLVASLTPTQRLAATLCYADDLSVGEVADTMQISVGSVKSTLSKARRNLRRTLGRGAAGSEVST